MFGQAKYIQNGFSITFQRYQNIRRKANEFEDLLKKRFNGHYGQPQLIPVPDELDPEVPRMIFGSKHGFSQIIISQIAVVLNAIYSPDWQTDISKGKEYLMERSAALFSLLETIDHMPVYFSGLTTRIQLPMDTDDASILQHLQKCFGIPLNERNTHDIQVKITSVHNETFYSNITIQNFRSWQIAGPIQGILPLSRQKASERGVEILGDFNDRYAFNEQNDYVSSSSLVTQIINEGLTQVSNTIRKVQEVSR